MLRLRCTYGFRAVARGAQRASRGLLPEKRVGTIQGNEADVVILILGSDPRRPRARAARGDLARRVRR